VESGDSLFKFKSSGNSAAPLIVCAVEEGFFAPLPEEGLFPPPEEERVFNKVSPPSPPPSASSGEAGAPLTTEVLMEEAANWSTSCGKQ